MNNKWGFINAWGTVLIPLQFDAALVFNEGIGVVANILK
ncbi:MAG: WG repeat-containing protein [Chitinophagaceae bacterium]|nr:WG repeat-containing protein [Chitinophagaceae bacterium]